MDLKSHRDRDFVHNELHARPVVAVPETARVRRLVFLRAENAPTLEEVWAEILAWCAAKNLSPQSDQSRQHTIDIDNKTITWERHNEFITFTWFAQLDDKDTEFENMGLQILAPLDLVASTRIDIINESEIPAQLLKGFQEPSLCLSDIEAGNAQIASDFTIGADGLTRFEFAAKNMTSLRRSILVRRLLEVDTYCKLTLFGLPPIRRIGRDLNDAETEISALLNWMPNIKSIDDARAAMNKLNQLSLQIAGLGESTSYRVAASRAYSEVLKQRIEGLGEIPTKKGSLLSRFLLNRTEPAIKTMAATEKRITSAAQKVESAVTMLNARNGLELEIQNSEILNTILHTSKSQFRLQETVEGLSSIAITYYALGIIGYMLSGPLKYIGWSKEWTLSALAPVLFIIVFTASRKLWRK